MKVAIYSRGGESLKIDDLLLLLAALEKHKVTSLIHSDYFEQVKHLFPANTYETFTGSADLDDSFECLISMGGDGTILDTLTLIRNTGIPVIGINLGRLGFLTEIGKNELEKAVDALVQRTYMIDKRTLLHVDANVPLFGDTPFGLNEFAIHKRDTSSMIKIHTYLNGEFLNTYWADGLIVATPTGSTGYSLSCNGPVVFPESNSFIITPVAPHNLNVRPIIISDTNIVSFEVEGRADQYICALDSRKEIVSRDVQVAIKKEQFSFNLIRLHENSFLQTLRNKLSWGLDTRN
ncbi:MAG: NAD kinase [Chitinophagaceae bacterium]|nr:NAD kinase [Chitinophagaceae bacterium]MCW5929611.1 NAD kinase [Chitinophagaceae bacterium]